MEILDNMTSDTNQTSQTEHSSSNESFCNWVGHTFYKFIESNTLNFVIMGLNIYTTLKFFYDRSFVKSTITNIYNYLTPINTLQKISVSDSSSFFIQTTNRKYKQIIYKDTDLQTATNCTPIEKSPFISVEIMIERGTPNGETKKGNVFVYEIEFRTDTYDYYMSGNIFTHPFIKWFMQYHYNISLGNDYYTIHTMRRHDFETIVFIKGDSIILTNHLKK